MRILLFIAVLFFVSPIRAAYKGSVSFSQSEISFHRQMSDQMSHVSRNCLNRHKQEHLDFYYSHCGNSRNGRKVCVSKFYGERRYSKRSGQRRSDGKPLEFLPQALADMGFPSSWSNQMEKTSCVGLALTCLKEGFVQTSQAAQWEKIMKFVRLNNVGGTGLQHALQQIGWTIYYWNPMGQGQIDEATKAWDREESSWQSKGWHNYRYHRVMSRGTYWFNKVDNKWDMVGFGKQVPAKLYDAAFWVGTANTGYHVFPGTYEQVVEAHSTRHFSSINNLEFSDFNPMASGGGPRWTKIEKYRSGLIALPPGTNKYNPIIRDYRPYDDNWGFYNNY